MDEYAYGAPLVASAFYLFAGVRLLGLHHRTGERPELLIGIYFALAGLYYLAYNIPSLFRIDPWSPRMDWIIEWIYIIGIFPYLFFIRAVFRPNETWSSALVVSCSLFLLVGTAMGGLDGEIVYSLDNPWFIVQWVGYSTPCAWICWEAALARRGAQKRARIGLAQPVVVNRYLLLAVFGGFQVLACLSDLSFAHDISDNRTVSAISNLLLGSTEILSVVVLWFAFFPPSFYEHWITQRAAAARTALED